MKNNTLALLLTSSLSISGVTFGQTAPDIINYQGFVTDAQGDPLGQGSAVNRKVLFQIHTEDSGGALVWAEEHTATFIDGRFSVLLGQGIEATGVFAGSPRPSLVDALAGPKRYLGITVDDGNNSFGAEDNEISPRQRFTSSAYALRAVATDYVAVDNFRTGDPLSYPQGSYLEWNRDLGSGRTFSLNQRGLGGIGGFAWGEIGTDGSYLELMNVDQNGHLGVLGNISVAEAYVRNGLNVTGNLNADNVTFRGNLQVDGNISYTGDLSLSGRNLGTLDAIRYEGGVVAVDLVHVKGTLGGGAPQGSYMTWNQDNGAGNTSFINQPGIGPGGFDWRAFNSDGSYHHGVPVMGLSRDGHLNILGNFQANGTINANGLVSGHDLYARGGLQVDGGINANINVSGHELRARAHIHSDNGIHANGGVNANAAVTGHDLHARGNLKSDNILEVYGAGGFFPAVQGFRLGWNFDGTGSTLFANSRGQGPGGFRWRDFDTNGNPAHGQDLMTLSRDGRLETRLGHFQMSDARLKEDIVDLGYGLEEVLSLKPKDFRFIGEDSSHSKHLGFLAQEVQEVLPELVNVTDTEEENLSFNMTGIVPVLVNAIQEQNAENEALKAKLEQQEARLKKLEALLVD